MTPKFKFTKEEITEKALEIVKENGMQALTARSLAVTLGSSSKPIFSLFKNMEELQNEVIKKSKEVYQSFIERAMNEDKYPPYKASGIAYINFAKRERELFKLLFMRDRTGERIEENREEIRPLIGLIMKNLGICEDDAYLLHLELWIFVHGVATMAATSYLDLNEAFISSALTDIYLGLKHRFTSAK